MCCFSFLVDPFYYTLILSSLHAFISQVGYSQSAELIYSSFMTIFGRGEYKKFLGKWKELKGAKGEVSKVSAQDEFAKWAKLQRKVDKLQVEFDSQYSSRQKCLLAVQFVGSIVLRVLTYFCFVLFVYYNFASSVLSLDLLRNEMESVPMAAEVFAFPQAEKGHLSVLVWGLMVNLAVREFLNFL